MTGIPDELVEKEARAAAMLELGEDWPTNAALGGNGTGTRDDEYRDALTDQAREVLEAVGLPALLERVEAAEVAAVERPEGEPDDWQYGYHAGIVAERPEVAKVIAEYANARDALAAKVADYEATPSNLRECLAMTIRWRLIASNMSQADAAAFVGVSQKHLSQILNGRQDGSLSMWQRLLDFVNTDARTALTEGTDG